MRTRAQRSDGSRELGPMQPASLSSLPEDVLYHILKFVDENDDVRSSGINKTWASLRRAWVVHRSRFPGGEGDPKKGLNFVQSLAFSCDGKLLAIGAEGNPRGEVLTVLDAATGDLRRTFPRGRWTFCLDFSPTDSTVLVAGGARDLIAYNTATGNSRELWRGSEELRCVTFSPAGSTIAFCHRYMVAVIKIGGPDPTRDQFASDKREEVSVEELRAMQLHSSNSTRVLARAPPSNPIEGVAFSPTGSVLAVGIYDGTVKCYDVASGQVRSETYYHGGHGCACGIWTIGYSRRGIIAAGGPDGKLALFDASNFQLLREISPVGSILCFSPDGSMIAAHTRYQGAGGGGRVLLYEAETGDLRFVISRAASSEIPWIGAIRFSPDGKTVAVGYSDGRVALYDATTGDRRRMRRQPQALPAPPTA